MSINLPEIHSQIKDNCNVSDSQFWGYLSLCNMLLRLRELYFHENKVLPWEKVDKIEIGEWITNRENLWEKLEEESLKKIKIGEHEFDPFDLENINSILEPHGYIYGGGYGLLKKPNFFLGKLKEKGNFHNLNIYYIQDEICHDLTPNIAMHQNGSLYIRLDIFKSYLFQKFMELKKEFHTDVLEKGFNFYNIDPSGNLENPNEKFSELVKELLPILVYHEIGEGEEIPGEDQETWLQMLRDADHKITEIRLRAIKDVLADNSDSGTLKYIIESKNKGQLYFHLALIDESRKYVFPEVHKALDEFEKNNDWSLLDSARITLKNKAKTIRDELIEIYKEKKDIKSVAEFLKLKFA